MKKIITMIALIAFTATATAQVKFGVRWGSGIGLMSKDVHDDRYEGQNKTDKEPFSTSFYGGFFVEIPASEKLLLDLGAMYTNHSTTGKGKTMLHRIDVPLAIKYDISGFRPKVGLYASYIPGVTSFEDNHRSLTKNDLKKFDYGATFGLEYNFTEKFYIEANFNLGLANLLKEDPRHSNDYLRTRSILVGVGYRF
ncbi:MAG: porin family protein [Capnocytophaga ochracea]